MRILILVAAVLAWSAGVAQQLQINDGFGSGGFVAGSIVHPVARPTGAGEVFTRWRGDFDAFDRRDASPRFAMPAANVSLRPEFESLPGYRIESLAINGSQARYALPRSAGALLLRFHGTGGSAAGQFATNENILFVEAALARGFAVASLDSVDRGSRTWNAQFSLANPDVQNVAALIAELRLRGAIGVDAPVVVQGTSNGCAFASRVSALLDLDGQALSICAGISDVIRQARVPTFWSLSRRDSVIAPDSILVAEQSMELLRQQQVPAALHIVEPTPVYPERFTRIRGLSLAQSLEVHQALVAANALGPDDFLLVPPSALEGVVAGFSGELAPFRVDIGDQIKLAYADHEFSNEYQHLMLDFLQSRVFVDDFD